MQPTNNTPDQQPSNQPQTQSGGTPPQQPTQLQMDQQPQNPQPFNSDDFSAPQSMQSQNPEPQQQSGGPGNIPGRSKKVNIIIAAAVALVVVAGLIFAFLLNSNKGDNTDANMVANESASSDTSDAKDASSLSQAAFVAPADMSAFKANAGTAVFANHDLIVAGDNADQCRLSFGIAEESEAPGANIDAILQPQIDAIKKSGASVEGPKAGKPLVLQSADDGQSYRLPTLEFIVSRDGAREFDYFSLVILGNGKRAVVSRACANANGQIDAKNLSTVQATAEKLKITTK